MSLSSPFANCYRAVTVAGLRCLVRSRCQIPPYTALPDRSLYLAYTSLPWHTTGYTNRTQAMLNCLQGCGFKVRALTRSGYPADMGLPKHVGEIQVGDIAYDHAAFPSNRWPLLPYTAMSAGRIEREAKSFRASVIHAASNHTNAMPALVAARRLGIAFQYEMRGLWELSRASKEPEYKDTFLYKFGLELEGFVAKHADRLFVISKQLGLYAQEHWGIEPEKIELLPNCVDVNRVCPNTGGNVKDGLIGYAGAFVEYEGLDTLLQAMKLLKGQYQQAKLLLIGDGDTRPALERLAGELGLLDRVTFLGKLPPEMARVQLQCCSLVCIPRKPYQVCEIVPPIKLVEAMALAKPVIVPDLPVFRDEMPEDAGWFFRAGDAEDLANTTRIALSNKELMRTKGQAGHQYVINRRQWNQHVGKILDSI